jgi:hypothetical protein
MAAGKRLRRRTEKRAAEDVFMRIGRIGPLALLSPSQFGIGPFEISES